MGEPGLIELVGLQRLELLHRRQMDPHRTLARFLIYITPFYPRFSPLRAIVCPYAYGYYAYNRTAREEEKVV